MLLVKESMKKRESLGGAVTDSPPTLQTAQQKYSFDVMVDAMEAYFKEQEPDLDRIKDL